MLVGTMIAFSLCLLAAVAEPPPSFFHAVADVNDPLSHGTLGDGKLSLNEAIRLHNGTLLYTQLSAAEQALVNVIPNTGGTTDVSWVDIDGGDTPLITIEQDLDPILDTPAGMFIRGFGELVTLDFTGPGITRGIDVPANSVILQNLRILGGPYGVDVVQTDATGQIGGSFDDMVFEGQSQFGVRVDGGVDGGVGRLVVRRCRFLNVPSAIEYNDLADDRNVIFQLRDSEIVGATYGVRYQGGTNGTAAFTFDKSSIEASDTGIDLAVAASNGRSAVVEGLHLRCRAPVCARIGTATDAVTWMDCGMWSLFAAPGGTALELGGPGHDVFGDLREFQTSGDVAIEVGAGATGLQVRNGRFRDGDVTLSTSMAQPFTVTESRFDGCDVETVGAGNVDIDGSCFVGGSFGNTSPAGAFQVVDSYVQTAGVGVQLSNPLPAEQLGSMSVSPDDVPLGGQITFAVDLPPGLVAVFALGLVPLYQTILPPPFHIYVDPLAVVTLPGAFQGQQSMTWTAPNLIQLAGEDLCVQPIVLAGPGVQAPPLQFAPGWRFVLL